MNKKEMVISLLLEDPEFQEELHPASDITDNDDGSYSFEVANESGERRWRHTIRTEEIPSVNTQDHTRNEGSEE